VLERGEEFAQDLKYAWLVIDNENAFLTSHRSYNLTFVRIHRLRKCVSLTTSERDGRRVETASNGAEALCRLEQSG
jgi:hypothetical protein